MCKRDKLFEGWVFSIAFVPIVFIDDNALCMVLNYVHYPALLLPCLATWWILTKSPRCDGINLCRGVVRSELGGVDQYSSYCSVFQASSFKLKAVFRYTRAVSNTSMLLNWVILSPETWLSIIWQKKLSTVFCGNKTVHDCCCFELFYRLELDFLGKVRNNLFLFLFVANVEMILSALLIHDWRWNSIMDEYDCL